MNVETPKQAEYERIPTPQGAPDNTTYWSKRYTYKCQDCCDLGIPCNACGATGEGAEGIAQSMTELLQLADFAVRHTRDHLTARPATTKEDEDRIINYIISMKPNTDRTLNIHAITYEGYGLRAFPGNPVVSSIPLLEDRTIPPSRIRKTLEKNLRIQEADDEVRALDELLTKTLNSSTGRDRGRYEYLFEVTTDLMIALSKLDQTVAAERNTLIYEQARLGEEARHEPVYESKEGGSDAAQLPREEGDENMTQKGPKEEEENSPEYLRWKAITPFTEAEVEDPPRKKKRLRTLRRRALNFGIYPAIRDQPKQETDEFYLKYPGSYSKSNQHNLTAVAEPSKEAKTTETEPNTDGEIKTYHQLGPISRPLYEDISDDEEEEPRSSEPPIEGQEAEGQETLV